MPTIFKPIYLNERGTQQNLADGAIVNIGGTSQSNFSVGGKGILFDDGTSSSGGAGIDLQAVYNNSLSPATIKLTTGKDFVIADDTDNGLYFKVDAETGAVLITGDLTVLGASTTINSTEVEGDHWLISPASPLTTALKIEPDTSIVPLVDLVTIRKTYGSAPVFRINKDGDVLAQNLTLSGLLNGINIQTLNTTVNNHITASATIKHIAAEISVATTPALIHAPTATNVQEALVELDAAITTGGGGGGNTNGYEHIQSISSAFWIIPHNKGTRRVKCTVYDDQGYEIMPDAIQVVDTNTVHVVLGLPMTGSMIMFYF